MNDLPGKLNEILSDEWACVRALRRAEARCEDPGQREIIKRIRKDCSVNCVALANLVRQLGGGPTDLPSPRFSLKLADESLPDILDLIQSIQTHILAEIEALLDEPGLKHCRTALTQIQQLHKENLRWMKRACAQ